MVYMSNTTNRKNQILISLSSLIFFIGVSILLPLHISQAKDLGCCIKTHKTGPTIGKKDYMDATKEECTAVAPGNPDDAFTVEFKAGMMAFNNTECRERPVVESRSLGDPIYVKPSVSIPDSEFTAGRNIKVEESTITLANYIIAIFKYSTGVIGIIAAIALMLGGITWLTAGGNHERISSAKTMIGSSLMGMCLAFGAFLILSIVNTNLVNLKIPAVQKVERMDIGIGGCCKKFSNNPLGAFTTQNLDSQTCEKLNAQVGDNDNQYYKIEFMPYMLAEENDCVPLGCCDYIDYPGIKDEVLSNKQCEGKNGTFHPLTNEQLATLSMSSSCLSLIQ